MYEIAKVSKQQLLVSNHELSVWEYHTLTITCQCRFALVAVLQCEALSPSEHGNVSSTDTLFGSVVVHTCETGFTFDIGPSVETRCNETGGWSKHPGQCHRKSEIIPRKEAFG